MIYDALRGLDVDLRDYRVPGHGGRGITPRGVLIHHTASNANAGDLPSLSTCIHGRPDVPGPLCQILIGRAGTVAVITDGRANHAGKGKWPGISDGNGQLIGVEIENDGRGEPWSLGVLAVAAKVTARLCDALDLDMVIGHKEWAPGRKIDPSFDMDGFRTAVTSVGVTPVSIASTVEDDMLAIIAADDGSTPWYATNGVTKRALVSGDEVPFWQFLGAHTKDGAPIPVPRAWLDSMQPVAAGGVSAGAVADELARRLGA